MKRIIIIAGVLLIGCIGVWFAVKHRQTAAAAGGSRPPSEAGGGGKKPSAFPGPGSSFSGKDGDGGGARAAAPGASTNAPGITAADFLSDGGKSLTGEERRLVEKLQDALDALDLNGVKEAARQLKRSESAPARKRTAEALGWFGTQALPDLIDMLGDPDMDVAEAVSAATLEAIDEMEDGPEKAEMLAAYIASLSDLNALDSALMMFAGMEDDIVIPHLERLIADCKDPAKLAALQEFYRFFRGEDFT